MPGAGTAKLVFKGEDGNEIVKIIHVFDGPGIIQGIHNTDRSIEGFARSCFEYALGVKHMTHASRISSRSCMMKSTKRNLMLSARNTSIL